MKSLNPQEVYAAKELEEDIKNVWDSADYLINLRKYKCKDNSCCNCKFYDFCNGGCPALKMRKGLLISEMGDDRCQILKGEK